MHSRCRCVLTGILPESRWEWCLYLFVLLCAIRPWALSGIMYPHDPPGVRVIYSSTNGDAEYYPIINALARGNMGETAVYELRGSGVQAFPLASLLYHASIAALLGPLAGYFVADILVTFLFFFALRAWCRLFSPHKLWTSFLAALYTSRCFEALDDRSHGVIRLGALWGDRIPRPFVSEIYLVAGMGLLAWMTWKPEHRGRLAPWLMLGGLLSLSLQSYIYYVPALGIATGFIALQWLFEDWRALPIVFSRAACALLAFLIASLPFLYQRVFTSPDAAGRMGLFPVDRGFIWLHTPWARDASSFAGLAILGLWLLSNAFSKRWNLPTIPGRVLAVLAVLQVAAYFAIPLTATLSGHMIQPYHFLFVSAAIQTCLLIGLVAGLGLRLMPAVLHRPFIAGVILLIGFCLVPFQVIHRHILDRPLIRDEAIPDLGYHRAFAQLARELSRDTYKDDLVLGTTERLVYDYWVGFRDRYAFFPDAFASTLPNRIIEDRLLWFAREEEIDPKALPDYLKYCLRLTFLGSDLYQCAPLYHAAPLDDYSPEDLKMYLDVPVSLETWSLALPLSEIARLQVRYSQILALDKNERPRLDLIILSSESGEMNLPDPDPSRYILTYHDDHFRVWQARKSAP